jgi:hypothetical protein
MYRIISAILMITLMVGALILVADNKLAAENAKLTPGIVVTASRPHNQNKLVVMPEIAVTAQRPKPIKISSHSDNQISYAALDLTPAFANKFDANTIDQLAAIKVKGNYNVAKDETINEDVVVTGGNAVIDGVIKGDLAVMGGAVEINGSADGDVAVFGGNLSISGNVQGDAAVFGGNIKNKGVIKGDLFVAGGLVALDSGSVVEDRKSVV